MSDKLFVSEEELINDSFRLGVDVFNDDFRPTFIVGLWRGGSTVGIYVQECLEYLGVQTDHISLRTSYAGMTAYRKMVNDPQENIRVHGTQYLLESLGAKDRLLIVDDVCGSGLTLETVIKRLKSRLRRNMPDFRTAVVWNKPELNRSGRQPDYSVYETNMWLVLPYELDGLTAAEITAHKPHVAGLLD